LDTHFYQVAPPIMKNIESICRNGKQGASRRNFMSPELHFLVDDQAVRN
jgi:hypothetical protein